MNKYWLFTFLMAFMLTGLAIGYHWGYVQYTDENLIFKRMTLHDRIFDYERMARKGEVCIMTIADAESAVNQDEKYSNLRMDYSFLAGGVIKENFRREIDCTIKTIKF